MVDRLRELRYDRGHPAQNVRVYTDEEDDLRVGTPSDLVQAFAHKYENLGLAQDDWLDVTAVPRPPLTPKHCAACVRKQVDSIPLEDILPFDTPERNAGEFDDLPFVIGGDFSLGEVRMIYDPQTHRPMVSTYREEGKQMERAYAAMPVVGRPLSGLWLKDDTATKPNKSAKVIAAPWMEAITVREEPKYDGRHTGHIHPKAFLNRGETFKYTGEPVVVQWYDDVMQELYDITFFKLAGRRGWVHDFHHDHPLTKTILITPWEHATDDEWHYVDTRKDEALACKVLNLNTPSLLSQHRPNTKKIVQQEVASFEEKSSEVVDLATLDVEVANTQKVTTLCECGPPSVGVHAIIPVDGPEQTESRLDLLGMSVCQVLQVHWIAEHPMGVFWDKEKKQWEAKIRKAGKTESLGYFDDEEEAAHAASAASRSNSISPTGPSDNEDEAKSEEENLGIDDDEETMYLKSYEVVVFLALPLQTYDGTEGVEAQKLECAQVRLKQVWINPAYPCGWVLSTVPLWQDLQEHAEKFRKNWRPTERWSHLDRRASKDLQTKMKSSFYMSAHVRHVDSGSGVCPLNTKRGWRPFGGDGAPTQADMSGHPLGLPTDVTYLNDLHASFFQHRTDPKTGIKYLNQAVQKEKDDNMGEIRLVMTLRPDNTGNGTTELWIRVVEARGIMPADSNGGSDPYVEVYLCDDEGDVLPNVARHRTPVRDNTLRPYWNTRMILGRGQTFDAQNVSIRVDLYDHDPRGIFGWNRDDCIGSTHFPMWEMRLSESRTKDLWAPIHANLGSKFGILHELHLDDKLNKFWENKKYELMSTVQQKLDVVGKRWEWDVVGDPWMPKEIRWLLSHLILGIFHEVRELLEGILKKQVGIKAVANHQNNKSNSSIIKIDSEVTACCYWYVAWLRYHLDPCDKDIWQRLTDPWFIVFLILGACPAYGLQTFVFLVKIAIIDRKDDYQLINYVATFKGLQFIAGLVSTVQGLIQYISCTRDDEHTCKENGPGMGNAVCTWYEGILSNDMSGTECTIISLMEFIIKVVLVYYAFYCMRFSTSTVGKLRIDERLTGALISLPRKSDGKVLGRRASYAHGDHEGANKILQEVKAKVLRFNPHTCEHQLLYLPVNESDDPFTKFMKKICCPADKSTPVHRHDPRFDALKSKFFRARAAIEVLEKADLSPLLDRERDKTTTPYLRTLQAVGRLGGLIAEDAGKRTSGQNLDSLWADIKTMVDNGSLLENATKLSPLRSIDHDLLQIYRSIGEECLDSFDEPADWDAESACGKLKIWASTFIELALLKPERSHQDILDVDLRAVHFRVLCPPGLERSPLNFLVRWDIFVVLALAAGFTWCGIYNDFTAYSWHTQSIVYWARTLYMLFSVPFLVLRIPGLNLVITHAQRTGYNRLGSCVKFQKVKLPFHARPDIMQPWSPEEDAFLREEIQEQIDGIQKAHSTYTIKWGNHHDRHPADLIDWESLAGSNHHAARSAEEIKARGKLLFEGDLTYLDGAERGSPNQRAWTHEDDVKCREAVLRFGLANWKSLNNASNPVITPKQKEELKSARKSLHRAYHKALLDESQPHKPTENPKFVDEQRKYDAQERLFENRKEKCKWELVADYVNGHIDLTRGCTRACSHKGYRKVFEKSSDAKELAEEDMEAEGAEEEEIGSEVDAAVCRNRWSSILEPGLYKTLKHQNFK